MAKKIKYNEEARKLLKQGVDGVANAVKVTLGARGRNVIIDKGYPHVTKDGVTVAETIDFADPISNMGCTLVKEAARNTCFDAGDGTTTATILAQAMINEGMKYVRKGYNPMEIKKGIDHATHLVVNFIESNSKKINNDYELMRKVATVSSNNDKEIGSLITKAFKKVTMDGEVTAEEAKGYNTELKIVEGLKFDKGFYSPHFKIPGKDKSILENVYILVSDKKIQKLQSVVHLAEKVIDKGGNLLIMCDEMDVEPLSSFVVNHQRGMLRSCVVEAPGFGDVRKEYLEDIAALTGGIYISDDKAHKLDKLSITELGKASKVIITERDTTIINGEGTTEQIQSRVDTINDQLNNEKDKFRRKILRERKGKLIGGVAILSIGGNSDSEIKEKADRIDDAISATRAAVEEGIVPGGGIVFMRATEKIKSFVCHTSSFNKGQEIVSQAIQEPFKTILRNAGIRPTKSMIREAKTCNYDSGYNVITEKWEHLYRAGIIDPAKVLRVSILNAASVAGMFLITECAITNEV